MAYYITGPAFTQGRRGLIDSSRPLEKNNTLCRLSFWKREKERNRETLELHNFPNKEEKKEIKGATTLGYKRPPLLSFLEATQPLEEQRPPPSSSSSFSSLYYYVKWERKYPKQNISICLSLYLFPLRTVYLSKTWNSRPLSIRRWRGSL